MTGTAKFFIVTDVTKAKSLVLIKHMCGFERGRGGYNLTKEHASELRLQAKNNKGST